MFLLSDACVGGPQGPALQVSQHHGMRVLKAAGLCKSLHVDLGVSEIAAAASFSGTLTYP